MKSQPLLSFLIGAGVIGLYIIAVCAVLFLYPFTP